MIEELYELYKKDVYYYIYSLCHEKELSEDLTSETFYQVMLSLSSFQGKSQIKTWIFSIARHITFQEVKKRKIEISLDVLPEQIYVEDYTLLMNEVHRYMDKQPEIYKEVFQLRLEGYAFDEIAEKLKMNPSSIRVIHHRNKLYLQKKLKRGEEDE